MAFSVIQDVYGYSTRLNKKLHQGAKTAILVSQDPSKKVYTIGSKVVKMLQVEAGKPGLYDKNKGFNHNRVAGSAAWKDYTPIADTEYNISVDVADAMAAVVAGQEPVVYSIAEDYVSRTFAEEFDQVNIANLYGGVPSANRKVNSAGGNYQTDATNILNTLITLQGDMLTAGWSGETILFMAASVYTNLQRAMITGNSLAGIALGAASLTPVQRMYKISTGLTGDEFDGALTAITVPIDVVQFGQFSIIIVPDNRMYTEIDLYDGYGEQAAGGAYPNTDADGFANIKLLALPIGAAFADIRWNSSNLFVPSMLLGAQNGTVNVDELAKRMLLGNFEYEVGGINQLANGFQMNIRTIFGAEIIDINKSMCFSVTDLPNVLVTGITVTGAGGSSSIATDGGTLQLTATATPDNATDNSVTWSVATDDASKATVSDAGLVTALTNGAATVNATANDGSGKVGTIEVTITNQ